MKAISLSADSVLGEDDEQEPYVTLRGDQIKQYLGDFEFQKGVRYEVPFTFEVVGWHKDKYEGGKEVIELCLKEGGEAVEVGAAEEPKPEKKEEAEVKVAKVTVKPPKTSTY